MARMKDLTRVSHTLRRLPRAEQRKWALMKMFAACCGFQPCSRCEEMLPIEQFAPDRHRPFGYRSTCAVCTNERRLELIAEKAPEQPRTKGGQFEGPKHPIAITEPTTWICRPMGSSQDVPGTGAVLNWLVQGGNQERYGCDPEGEAVYPGTRIDVEEHLCYTHPHTIGETSL